MSMSSFGSGNVANKSNKLVLIVILASMLLVLVGSLVFFSKVIQTETYWVLNQPVPQKGRITPEMLKEVETSKGSAPVPVSKQGIALTETEVASGNVFSRIPLQPGDLVTTSNTTSGFSDIRVGIPDEWTITSISVPADNAVGGRITRGTYFDIMAVNTDTKQVYYPFLNLLCLETSVSLNTATSANAANTGEAKAGQTELYYVGLPMDKIAELRSLAELDNVELYLNLAPIQNDYNGVNFDLYAKEDGSKMFSFNPQEYEFQDMGLGTDSNFNLTKRDPDLRPTEIWPNGAPKETDANKLTVGNAGKNFGDWQTWFAQYEDYLSSNGRDIPDPTKLESAPSVPSGEGDGETEEN